MFVSGFKCFSNSTFNLKSLTVLTGNNGTGKSSLIQSILLTRLAIEKNLQHSEKDNYTSSFWKGVPIPLNNGYELKLGTVYDVFNNSDNYSGNTITIRLDDDTYEFRLPEKEESDTSVTFSFSQTNKESSVIPFWRRKEFYYLHTERLGPRQSLESNFTDFVHCGHKGEYTAQVLLKNWNIKVADQRKHEKTEGDSLRQNVDEWLKEICPGISISVKPLGEFSAQIWVRNVDSSVELLAPNIGFGISYSLPIIVNGLIAQRDSVFIVENPEAHLHPKGQSNIGFFLGKVAAAGVRVIIETHSEHVVNGLRRAALSSVANFTTNDVMIYFFNNSNQAEGKVMPISIRENGDLSRFPVDFFDQTRQDLLEILKLSKR